MQTIQTAFTLGKTVLPRTAVLAPMAGVADRACSAAVSAQRQPSAKWFPSKGCAMETKVPPDSAP
jgi:hypothetical protein